MHYITMYAINTADGDDSSREKCHNISSSLMDFRTLKSCSDMDRQQTKKRRKTNNTEIRGMSYDEYVDMYIPHRNTTFCSKLHNIIMQLRGVKRVEL